MEGNRLIATFTTTTTASITIFDPVRFQQCFEELKPYWPGSDEYTKENLLHALLHRSIIRREEVEHYGVKVYLGSGSTKTSGVRTGQDIEF
jgi:hypothetical protein